LKVIHNAEYVVTSML